MEKIFDIHTHTYPEKIAGRATESLGHFYDFTVEGEGTYAHLESQAKANHIRGYLLFSVATNAHQVPKVNDSIAALAEYSRSRGFLTVGFAGMHQDYPDFAGEMDRAEGLGLRGVKLHPDIQEVDADDPRLFPLYEILAAKHMPLYLHVGDNRQRYRYSHASKVVRILENFPTLTVAAAHLGGYMAWDDALTWFAANRNKPWYEHLWFDTSSSLWAMTPERARHMIDSLGADHIMFGTDYPVKNIAGEIARFDALDLPSPVREDILWNNAVRFLHLEKEAAALEDAE